MLFDLLIIMFIIIINFLFSFFANKENEELKGLISKQQYLYKYVFYKTYLKKHIPQDEPNYLKY